MKTHKNLDTIISESVDKALAEMTLKNTIKQLVRESLDSMGYGMNTPMEDKKEDDAPSSDRPKRRHSAESEHRRQIVISALNPETSSERGGKIKLDVAPYAYALWPDKDEDSARSYFYKCLKGETNDSGVPYEFDDGEINKLYTMLSNNSI